jgi:glycerophosphoryl diester phosphodiesterase
MLSFRCLCFLAILGVVSSLAAQAPRVTLTGYARMAPDTFAPGPASGAWLVAGKEGIAQFKGQPVQGFSALWPADSSGRAWFVLVDNGFGAKINSADALLRIYRLLVTWAESRASGGGQVIVDRAFIEIADPDRKLPFPIARGETRERWLTGADLDPESFVRMPDGSFWIGDEFGPFLVHVSATGSVLDAPVEVPGLRSPDHPHLQSADAGQMSAATVRRSRGFESLSAGAGFRALYPALESAPLASPGRRVFTFDPARRALSDETWDFPLDGEALTELVGLEQIFGATCANRFLAVERDGAQGAAAKIKRVHEVVIAGGKAVRTLVVDLLDIINPEGLGGYPVRFTFPYITTEAVWPVDRSTLVIVNDNNFPNGGGRPNESRDATEFIRLHLNQPLCAGGAS